MFQIVRSVSALVLGAAVLQVGTGLFGTFIAVRMDLEGFAKLTIGGVGSAYFAGFILGAVLAQVPVRRVGHIRSFAALAAVMCATTLIFALVVQPAAWVIFRFAHGLALSGLFVITESWLNERADNRTRGGIFSLYMIANYAALGGSQFLLPLYPVTGSEIFILVGICYAAALLPVALSRTAAPQPYAGNRLSMVQLYRISPLGVIGCVVCGLVNSAFYALAPVFVVGVGLGAAAVSQFMGIAILAGLILQWPLGKLSDVFDRRAILVVIAFASSFLAVGIALVDGNQLWLILLALGYGGAAFTIYGIAVAHANDHLQPTDLVPASAGLLIAYGIGAAIGPVPAAMAMEIVGPGGLFAFIAAMLALLAAFGLARMRLRGPVPKAEQVPYMAVPRTSPVVGELDPRGEAAPIESGEASADTAR